MATICPKCGTPIADDAVFCTACGAEINRQEVPQPTTPTPTTCSHCGAQLAENAAFCAACGNKVNSPAAPKGVCPNCGTQLADGATFCTTCGTKIGQQETSAIQEFIGNVKEKCLEIIGKIKEMAPAQLATIAAGAVGCLVVIILFFSLLFPGPKAVAKKFLNGVEDGNAKKVVRCLPSFFFEEQDKDEMIEELEEIFEEFEDFDKFKVEFEEISDLKKSERDMIEMMLEGVEDDVDNFDADDVNVKKAKKVEFKIKMYDGDDYEKEDGTLYLIKYRGRWKVIFSDAFFW